MKSESDPDDYHSISEFAAAIEELVTLDYKKLWLVADRRIRNAGLDRAVYEPDELISEAVGASLKEGGKRWRKGVKLETHLWHAMRNIANRWVKRERPLRFLDSMQSDEEVDEDDPLENVVAEQESTRVSVDLSNTLRSVEAALEGDEIALNVIKLKLKEMTASEIQKILKISEKQYQAALRRIQRNKDLNRIHEYEKEDLRRA